MDRAKKEQLVAELRDKLQRASISVLTDFQGLTVAEITDLRDQLAAQQVEYRVVKNTLMRLASRDTDSAVLEPLVKGTCALALGYDEPTVAAKLLKTFMKSNAKLKIKAGALGQSLLNEKQVEALADLPSREVLLAKLLGTMSAVPSSLVRVLSGVPRAFVGVLAAIERQRNEA